MCFCVCAQLLVRNGRQSTQTLKQQWQPFIQEEKSSFKNKSNEWGWQEIKKETEKEREWERLSVSRFLPESCLRAKKEDWAWIWIPYLKVNKIWGGDWREQTLQSSEALDFVKREFICVLQIISCLSLAINWLDSLHLTLKTVEKVSKAKQLLALEGPHGRVRRPYEDLGLVEKYDPKLTVSQLVYMPVAVCFYLCFAFLCSSA